MVQGKLQQYTANKGPLRIQYKCVLPIFRFRCRCWEQGLAVSFLGFSVQCGKEEALQCKAAKAEVVQRKEPQTIWLCASIS
jgi:hypothetical protein